MTFWDAGTQITWHFGPPGLDFVSPMTVVQDDERGLVAWLPVGTPVLKVVRADGRPLRAVPDEQFAVARRQVPGLWEGYSVLRVYRPGTWWSVWHFFDGATGEFEGWYVNIEDPHTREGRSTRTRDHVLDIEVTPDRSFQRKDEDELIRAVEQGRYTTAEAEAITRIADQAEDVIRAWRAPFCDGWESFRPDPGWPVPALP